MFITAVPYVAETRFLAEAITDNIVRLQRKKEKGEKKGRSRAGKVDGRGGRKRRRRRGAGVVGYAVR